MYLVSFRNYYLLEHLSTFSLLSFLPLLLLLLGLFKRIIDKRFSWQKDDNQLSGQIISIFLSNGNSAETILSIQISKKSQPMYLCVLFPRNMPSMSHVCTMYIVHVLASLITVTLVRSMRLTNVDAPALGQQCIKETF